MICFAREYSETYGQIIPFLVWYEIRACTFLAVFPKFNLRVYSDIHLTNTRAVVFVGCWLQNSTISQRIWHVLYTFREITYWRICYMLFFPFFVAPGVTSGINDILCTLYVLSYANSQKKCFPKMVHVLRYHQFVMNLVIDVI